MQELKINKFFDTYEELQNEEKRLSEEYCVIMILEAPQEFDRDVYGIESIIHCGKK